MLRKPIDQITLPDIQSLVENSVQEGKTLEYKRDFYRLDADDKQFKDAQHEELLKDISAFANTIGGDLLIGVAEEDHVASEVCGIEVADIDGLKRRIIQLCENWLEPRVTLSIQAVPIESGRHVFVIRVQRSTLAPHRVIYQKKPGQFWARNSGGAYSMDTQELRQAFLLSETVSTRIRRFRQERVREIADAMVPTRLSEGPKLIMHLIPQDSFSSTFTIPTEQMQWAQLPLIRGSGLSPRFNLDGLLISESHGSSTSNSYACLQLFRSGVIESILGNIKFYYSQDVQKSWPFLSTYDIKDVFLVLPHYLRFLRGVGINPPIWCFLSMVGMKGVSIPSNSHSVSHPIDRDTLLFPELEIHEFDIGQADQFMRPIFDMIWNCGGYPNCPNYGEDGHYRHPS